jgi:actin-related protein 2
MNPRQNREKMCEYMFEVFGFQAVSIGVQAVLSLYSQGRSSGLVVDSGDGVTHLVPVYEGFVLPHLIKRLDLAGRDITNYLIKLLQVKGYAFNKNADFELVRQLKERYCYISCDLALERKLAHETTTLIEKYELPDGRVVKLDSERFEAPEVLFRPSLVDKEGAGLSQMVFELIQSADIDLRSTFYKQIILSGGTTMYPGFTSRLERDLRQLYLERVAGGDKERANKLKIGIEDPPQRKHMVFLGGSFFAELTREAHQGVWITRDEWMEKGKAALKKLEGGGQ